ncbi:MAG: VOC family protein [Thermodesulfobacteriota bacterium]|nr:VOC family protein [Thermodesulfobacteriota bacterium]
MIEGLAHVGVAVKDLDEGIKFFEDTFGATLDTSMASDGKMNFGLHLSAILQVGTMKFELMQPTQEGEGPVGKFLAKNGEGLHHISLKVSNYKDAKSDFESKGLTVMGEMREVMAFLHPKSCKGVLVEFTQV